MRQLQRHPLHHNLHPFQPRFLLFCIEEGGYYHIWTYNPRFYSLQVANRGGNATFWQIFSVFDVAYALGIAIGWASLPLFYCWCCLPFTLRFSRPFFAGFAASGHTAQGSGETD